MVGHKRAISALGEDSAIHKVAVDYRVAVGLEGLPGDEHAYVHHGGPHKALLHYASEHYELYAARFTEFACDLGGERGGFGENISTRGLSEENVCIGDRYRIAGNNGTDGIVVEVSGFRQPCYKLGFTSGVRELPRVMQDEATTGWFYRVIQTGSIAAGDYLNLVARPYPDWSIARLIRAVYGSPGDHTLLGEILSIPVIDPSFRTTIATRRTTGEIEDWNARLYGTG